MTFELIAQDAFAFHEKGFPTRDIRQIPGLPESGEYHWRDGGEPHINNPASIANIEDAVRTKNDPYYEAYPCQSMSRSKTAPFAACSTLTLREKPGTNRSS